MERVPDLPSPTRIVHGLAELLTDMPVPVVAGVVYGSVAKGCHHWDSDVDALLLTSRPPSTSEKARVVELFTGFVSDLGLRPDQKYPVELFPADDCRRMLGISPGGRHRRSSTSGYTPDDAWEALYALTTPHLPITGEQLLRELTDAARRRLALLANQRDHPGCEP